MVLLAPAGVAQVRPAQRVNVLGLNDSGGNQADGIGVATRGSRFAMVWAEQLGTSAGTQDIHFSVSDDFGLTWSPQVRIDTGDGPNASDSDEPKVVITGDGTIVAVWEDVKDARSFGTDNEDLFYNRSSDGGATWLSPSLPLNTPTSGAHASSDVDRISIAADGDRICVVWEEDSLAGAGGAEEIWFTRSTDAGATWTAPRIVTSTTTIVDADDPKVAVRGSNVVIGFIDDGGWDDDVYALGSTDFGTTFTKVLVESATTGDVDDPQLAMDGDLVALVWQDADAGGASDGLHGVVSQDGGRTWRAETVLAPRVQATPGARVSWAVVAVRDPDVYVVYTEDSESVAGGGPGGLTKLYASVSNSRGGSWTFDVPLDAADGRRDNRPAVAVGDAYVVVCSETGAAGANGLGFTYSGDHGATWSPLHAVPGVGPDVDSEDLHEGTYFVTSASGDLALAGFWDRPTGTNELYASAIEVGSVTRYCPTTPNSTGAPAVLDSLGTTYYAANDFGLRASGLPDHPGIFLLGRTAISLPYADGYICLGGVRFLRPPLLALGGVAERTVDLPSDGVLLGTNTFQYWYRDPGFGVSNNLSDALEVTFR